MKWKITRIVLSLTLCAAVLPIGGCCDQCVKGVLSQMWSIYTQFARMKAECCLDSTTTAEYQACTEQVRAAEIQAATAIAAALSACQMEEYDRARQIMEDFLDTIDRLFPSLFPIGPTSNEVVEIERGVYRNSLTLFMPSDGMEFWVSASTDGVPKKRDTILVNGTEVLPEAAGKAAVKAGEGDPEAQPATIVVRREVDAAMDFRAYTIDANSSVQTRTMLGDIEFDVTGDFELSKMMFADDNSSEAIPRETRFVVTTDIGAVHLVLDQTNPGNRLRLDPNGKGVLRGAYFVKGTDQPDVVSELLTSVWVEIPVMYDFASGAIDTAFAGDVKAGSVAPDSTVEDDENPYNLPGTITIGCAEDGDGLNTGSCACIDTDGDGVPDSYAFEELMRNVYRQHVEQDWCD